MFLPNPGHCVCLLTNRRYFLRTVLVFISMFAGLSQTCQNKECIINFRIKALDFLKLHCYNEEVISEDMIFDLFCSLLEAQFEHVKNWNQTSH